MATLSIKNILPDYFEDHRKNTSDIWGKNFTFTNGDRIKIVAPSGTGKTSLIHFLYRLRQDYSGNILYNEKDVKQHSHEEIALLRKNHVSVILQDMRLFGERTILENLEIKSQLHPYHSQQKIFEMAKRLGIENKLQSRAGQCSYGEQQRAVIIRALLQPFDFLLMDEPFSHLDHANSKKAMELVLEEAQQRNAAIIFAELERVDYYPATHLYHL
ncbi:MAG: ATP-binding cassette domain-containing protein [Chitinophagaceae bacterium]|nr:ATP-binding cassette domain-containing protein [Chitinophagaceae bacterium]